jgi:hypothetical protein
MCYDSRTPDQDPGSSWVDPRTHRVTACRMIENLNAAIQNSARGHSAPAASDACRTVGNPNTVEFLEFLGRPMSFLGRGSSWVAMYVLFPFIRGIGQLRDRTGSMDGVQLTAHPIIRRHPTSRRCHLQVSRVQGTGMHIRDTASGALEKQHHFQEQRPNKGSDLEVGSAVSSFLSEFSILVHKNHQRSPRWPSRWGRWGR